MLHPDYQLATSREKPVKKTADKSVDFDSTDDS